MDTWLSISQLSEVTEIPETTVRRYTNKFQAFFRYEKRGRGKKFHPDSIEVIKRIALLYEQDYEAEEIEKILAQDFPITVSDDDQSTTNQPPVKSIEQQFDEFKEQQEDFNEKLLEHLQEQQDYINKSIDRRDQELMQTLKEMQETKKLLIEQQKTTKKKWWQFWK